MANIKLSPRYWARYLYDFIRGSGYRTKSLVLGSGMMTISNVINIVTRFGLIALLTRVYTKDEFGLWISITSITSVMVNSDFGVASALRNKLVECRVKENGDDDAKRYFFSVIYFFLVFTLIISILLLSFRHYIPYDHLFKTNDLVLKTEGQNILIWVPILLLINIPFGIGPVMLFAYQEIKVAALLNIIIGILGLLTIGIAAFLHQSITVTTILYFLVNLLCNIGGTFYFVYRRKWFDIFINLKSALPKVWELVTQGVLFFIIQTSTAFLFNAATLVSTSQIGLSAASELSLAQRLYLLVVSIYAGVHNPLWAGFADAVNRYDWQWCKTTLLRVLYVTIPLFALATLVFTFSGNFFLTIIAGKGYVSCKWLLLVMGIWTLFYLLYGLFLTFLSATGKIKLTAFSSALSAFIIFPTASFFAHKYGNTGIICVSAIVFFLLTLAAYLQAFYLINRQKI